MHLPPVNTVDGAYWYFIAVLLAILLLVTLFIAGIAAGVIPDFSSLY